MGPTVRIVDSNIEVGDVRISLGVEKNIVGFQVAG